MNISSDRIRHDIKTIARFTSTAGQGRSCPTFSDQWRQAMDYISHQLENCGCQIRRQPNGNLRARPSAVDWQTPAWLVGSHVDSVPNGGDYDGVAGVVIPLEIIRAAHESGLDDLPIELVIFAEEEGTTFGNGMLGSLAWTGKIGTAELTQYKNSDGQSYLEAGKSFGVQADQLSTTQLDPRHFLGMIEVHIEQGPRMWRVGEHVAVVNGIAGRRQWRVLLTGQSNHAGSTPMLERHDSLAGAAEVILELEKLAPQMSPAAVITVGQLTAHPSAINVINGSVEFTIDFRDPSNEILAAGEKQIPELIDSITDRRGLTTAIEMTESLTAATLDQSICDQLLQSASQLGLKTPPITQSGALHDAAILADVIPTAMLFVSSRDGISHNPAEFSRIEDLAIAAQIIGGVVKNR